MTVKRFGELCPSAFVYVGGMVGAAWLLGVELTWRLAVFTFLALYVSKLSEFILNADLRRQGVDQLATAKGNQR